MTTLRAYLLQKCARDRAGDVAREIDPSGRKFSFSSEMGDVMEALQNKSYASLPKEVGQAALAGQMAIARNTASNLPMVGADAELEEYRRRRGVWRSAFSRYRIPFSETYLSAGGDFGRPDTVQAAFLAAGKELDEHEALAISVRMSKAYDQKKKDKEMNKNASFSRPENDDVMEETKQFQLSAGANDWEAAHTWVWVDIGDSRDGATRLWFQVKYPEGTTCEDDYDPKETTREDHASALKAGQAHGDRAWKVWLATAKKCIKAHKDDHGYTGAKYSRFDWKRGFQDALAHPDMAEFVKDSGELTSEFREKEASAGIAQMRRVIAQARRLAQQLGPDAADRYTLEHLGSVYRVARNRLATQAKLPTPPAVAPISSPLPTAKPTQLSFPFLKQSSLLTIGACLRRARNATHTHPTPSQAHAGNYKKGTVKIHGMTVKLENPKGTERRGYDADGNITWKRTMAADYGYFQGTKAIDGDAVDCFIGPDTDSNFVAAIDQKKSDGSFDETKFVLGCTNQEQAEKLYLAHYPRGWKLGPVSTTTVQQLKKWLSEGDTKAPFKGQMVKAAKLRPASELLRRLRDRRGECQVCGKPNQEGAVCACPARRMEAADPVILDDEGRERG